jgi:hypothetical protein
MHDSAHLRSRDPAARKVSNGGAKIEDRPRRLSGTAAVEQAKVHLLELTGQQPESVSALSRSRDGWRITLEVVELERIPRTTDILGTYVVELDDEGELMSYVRTQRYYRNEVGGEQ